MDSDPGTGASSSPARTGADELAPPMVPPDGLPPPSIPAPAAPAAAPCQTLGSSSRAGTGAAVGEADLNLPPADKLEDGEPTDTQQPPPPSVQAGSVGAADGVLQRKWKGQKKTGEKMIQVLQSPKCIGLFAGDEITDIQELGRKLSDSKDNSNVVKQISKYNNMIPQRSHALKRLSTEITEARTKLEERQAVVDMKAKRTAVLVQAIMKDVDRVRQQYELMPIQQAKEKLDKCENVLKWVLKLKVALHENLPTDELISRLEVYEQDLLKGTIWDHSPENTRWTTKSRPAPDKFEDTKFERFVFNPLRGSFEAFIQYVRDRLCDHPEFGTIKSKEGRFSEIRECHLLEKQTPSNQPPRWFIFEVQNDHDSYETFMRSDNCYISGFKTQKKGQIYEFKNADDAMPLLKGSIFFTCKNDYSELLNYERFVQPDDDLLRDRLKRLELTMEALSRGVKPVSRYDHTLLDPEHVVQEGPAVDSIITNQQVQDSIITNQQVQEEIARIAIMIPEVCRFLDLYDRVKQGGNLDDLLIEYMWAWNDMCTGIRNDEGAKFSEESSKRIDMTYHYEAFEHLYLLLGTKRPGLDENGQKPDKPKPKPPSEPKPKPKPPSEPSNEGGSHSQGKATDDRAPQDKSMKDDDDTTSHEATDEIAPQDVSCKDDDMAMASVVGPWVREWVSEYWKPRVTRGYGKPLFEVFSIYTNCPSIKYIAIFDDCCGKAIYRSKDGYIDHFNAKKSHWLRNNVGRDSSDFLDGLVLSNCATSAVSGFVIEVDVGDKDCVFHLPYEDTSLVDIPVTRSIFTSKGEIHVTSAIISKAIEASIHLDVFIEHERKQELSHTAMEVRGALLLSVEGMTIGWNIFSSFNDGAFLTQSEEEASRNSNKFSIPLKRRIVALPTDCVVKLSGVLSIGEDVSPSQIEVFYPWKPFSGRDYYRLVLARPEIVCGLVITTQ